MTDAVGGLVLGNNYKQTQALSLAERRARERVGEYKRLLNALEVAGNLDRALEFLPTDDELNERAANGLGLTRPELSVLISYSKIDLKESLLKSLVPDDEYLAREMETAFPPLLANKFGEPMRGHRLCAAPEGVHRHERGECRRRLCDRARPIPLAALVETDRSPGLPGPS